MIVSYLPGPPSPPHDPYRMPLDRRVGWRIDTRDGIEVSPVDGSLILEKEPGTGRRLNERAGTLGGLLPPPWMTLAPDGGIYLLDRSRGRILRFDPCACRFDPIPCLGGLGAGPRQVQTVETAEDGTEFLSGAVGVDGGNLFVADPGNGRLVVFTLGGFALRGFWSPPPSEQSVPWQPSDLAFSGHGSVFVADRANLCVHQFSRRGRWLRAITGTGSVIRIAVDETGDLYVVQDEMSPVRVFDVRTGEIVREVLRPEMVAALFPPTCFPVSIEGYVDLTNCCIPPPAGRVVFDDTGHRTEDLEVSGLDVFKSHGTAITEALDGKLYRCQWDRLSLKLEIPPGTRVRVRTYTSDFETSLAEIPDSAWKTDQEIQPGMTDWDCLIRSEGGRYLRLLLEFWGNRDNTPRIHRSVLDFPRITLRRYLPGVFGEEATSADFTDRFLAVFDRGFRQVEGILDDLPRYFDPLSTPSGRGRQDFLSWLASWIGITFDPILTIAQRRRLLKEAGRLFPCRGTVRGLGAMLELYLGLTRSVDRKPPCCGPCRTATPPPWEPPRLILEHFTLRRWLFLGAGRLGEQARLWGQRIVNRSQLSGRHTDGNAQLGVSQLKTTQDPFRDPFHVYAHIFTVFLPAWLGKSPQRRLAIERLIRTEKPAHTKHHLVFVEPRFRIGVQSMIGYDAVIGSYPEGVTLQVSRLGRGTVLDSPEREGPMRIGQAARIGTSTSLN